MLSASLLVEAAARPRTDLEQLQGSWVAVAGPRDARFLIAGNRFTFELADGDIYMGTFTLDPGADPKQMDLWVEEGPPAHKGQVALCIYHVEGDVLRWCPARVGSRRRLECFPSVDDDRCLSMVFKHARPRRA